MKQLTDFGAIHIVDWKISDAKDLLAYQANKINWETFKFKCLQRQYNYCGEISTDYAEWFDFHKRNDTHKSNGYSASLFEGLTDTATFESWAEDLTDEQFEAVYEYYEQEKSKLTNSKHGLNKSKQAIY